ncbi:SDR family NAD(P)-dependent oxidoreductase [Lederbergia lenta]|uniref:Short chain dehydrogenase/reductase family oxidoreductase n=1 Tax=Lederbergia lenta TaxID=1467 RepID=A0A2X4WIM3_LEDLE|nr:SDR family oxidoreductase [Lederbergia lenta]MCM3112001.1 SDR family oxidoreductase [Lederbergia lenta]MEC2323173.1 SDR family NAD(P)-dependent oxidoreductase [Lederbergia lenta]SQI62883.1 short chain dehydrogenase/reductase family oxidoreductase [Lederbergia lenta]
MSKTCMITGASRGIGRAIAISLSDRTDITNFILISRTEAGLEDTASQMNADKNIEISALDLTDYLATQELVQSVGQKYETIDMLINVAGYANPKSLLETSIDDWEETYSVNVHSIFNITKETVKYMKKTGGQILNVASTAGTSARPGWLAYASSKAAIISMSQTLSEELSDYGILVYCISPGRCATELRKVLAPDEDPSTIMQPEHVGEVVNQLLSNDGICLDGQNIVVRKQTVKAFQQQATKQII